MNTIETAVPGSRPVLSIVIPVFNDGSSVKVMIPVLRVLVEIPHEIVIVYDLPSDTTVPIVEHLRNEFANLKGVLNTRGRGVLNAVRAGVAAASGRYVLIYAADEITPVLTIGKMLHLMDQGCDLVSGTRYRAGGRRYGGSLLGHVLSWTANKLFRLTSATALSDCTTGIKMFRRELFDALPLSDASSGWSFAFEMAIHSQLLGFRLGEVPIVSIDRLFGGQSTFKLLPWSLAYSRLFVWGVCKLPLWHRPRPALHYPVERY
jgi:dolichol-phosphate mannosyltransferase